MSSKANPATDCHWSASKISEIDWFALIAVVPCAEFRAQRTRGPSRRASARAALLEHRRDSSRLHSRSASPLPAHQRPARVDAQSSFFPDPSRELFFRKLFAEPPKLLLAHAPEGDTRDHGPDFGRGDQAQPITQDPGTQHGLAQQPALRSDRKADELEEGVSRRDRSVEVE